MRTENGITASVATQSIICSEASDVMNLDRFMFAALALALVAVEARAQAPSPGAPACGGRSVVSGTVARVVDGRSFVFADGRETRLAGIETSLPVPGDEDEARMAAALSAKTALENLVLGREVGLSVSGTGLDRYGRLVAYVFVGPPSDQTLVQHELVATGNALVSPAPLAARCRTLLRDAEREARTAKLGLWGEPYYVVRDAANPADVLAEQGRFALVEGKVRSVHETGGVIYVNFGQRWSEQFTVTILKRNEGVFAGAGLTPKTLAGRRIEVRGWIEERSGPAIEVGRPEQIEIVH